MVEAIAAVGEFFFTLFHGLSAIFFIFSKQERAKLKARWNSKEKNTVVIELIYGALGIVVIVLALGYLLFVQP